MRTLKMLIVSMVALVMLVSLAACGAPAEQPSDSAPAESESSSAPVEEPSEEVSEEAPADTGTVLNIHCWNTEFQDRFVKFFEEAGLVPEGVTVNFVITPNEDNAYQNALDQALLNQESAAADEKVDIFLIEADYASKYVDTPYTLDVVNEVGLTDADLANQYQYTNDIASDSNGVLKGVTWQATPGLFAYRRSIAKDVLGTDVPEEVQAFLSDWAKFDETAASMSDKGYKMVSGFDDTYRTFSNNVSAPWVDADGVIQIDPNIMKWVDQTKDYTDKGYNEKTILWDEAWAAGQGPGSKVFGYFMPPWGFDFVLMGNSLETPESEGGKMEVGNGIYGDWGACEGPAGYYWGGTWICAAAGTDNLNLVKDVMYTMTCDAETLKAVTYEYNDFCNNSIAMEEIANDSAYGSEFLGGQNHIAKFASAAPNIDMSNISPYDQGCNEEMQTAMHDYFNGVVTKDEALENFYTAVIEKYPNLKKPE